MAMVRVVPPFDVLEARRADLGPDRELPAVDEVAFEGAKKLSAIALPQHSPTEPVDVTTPVSRQRFSSSYDA